MKGIGSVITANVDEIQKAFNKVIRYSQDIKKPFTDDLFLQWAKCKTRFYEAFGGKLIYEAPEKVCFEEEPEWFEEQYQDLIHYCHNELRAPVSLINFFIREKEGIRINKVVEPFYDQYEDVKVEAGMKLGKAVNTYWAELMNKDDLAKVCMFLSRIIQNSKIEGTLCFSIHPLDFLSTSENTAKWRSCHALDGEYRTGGISYMLDSCTFIAYLKSDKDDLLPNFPESVPWNNKKWRCLLFWDPERNMFYAGRQYPFFSHSALNYITKELYNLGMIP